MATTSVYDPPAISEIGDMHELTLAFNKNGSTPDIFSGIVPVVGDLSSAA